MITLITYIITEMNWPKEITLANCTTWGEAYDKIEWFLNGKTQIYANAMYVDAILILIAIGIYLIVSSIKENKKETE